VLYSSYNTAVLRSLTETVPKAPRALVAGRDTTNPIGTASRLDCQAIHPIWTAFVDRSFVSHANDEGLAINEWTIDSAEQARRLAVVGVDGIIADRWDVIQHLND
jgi:glycerophosphoryl diester phosphodiesterase